MCAQRSLTSWLEFWPQRTRRMAAHLPQRLRAAEGALEALHRSPICTVWIL